MVQITLLGSLGDMAEKIRTRLADGNVHSTEDLTELCGEEPRRALGIMYMSGEIARIWAGVEFWQLAPEIQTSSRAA